MKKKDWEHETQSKTSCSWCTRNGLQEFEERTREIGNQLENQKHPDNCIVEIGQNTQKN